MKIKFKILVPKGQAYSYDSDTIINYDSSSPKGYRGEELYKTFTSYFYEATGSGYDFVQIFSKAGFDVEKYYQVSAYQVTSLTATIIAKEAKRWSHAVNCIFPQGTIRNYFEGSEPGTTMSVYEWVPKSGLGKSIIVFGPTETNQTLNLMNSKSIISEYLEMPSESALEYFTGESIFLTKKSELKEALLTFNVSDSLRSAIDNFKEGYQFGMWCTGSIEDRFPGNPDDFPWQKKVSEFQNRMKDIIEDDSCCEFIKFRRTKRLLSEI